MSKKTAIVRVDDDLHARVKALLEQSRLRLDIWDFYEVAVRRMVEDVEAHGLQVIPPAKPSGQEASAEPSPSPKRARVTGTAGDAPIRRSA